MDQSRPSGFCSDRGYYLLPKPHPNSPGSAGLVIIISEHPTIGCFQPASIGLILRSGSGVGRPETLRRGSSLKAAAHVCPGLVSLSDGSDGIVTFFTFGGGIELGQAAGDTTYTIQSESPILEVPEFGQTASRLLAAETGALLAEIAAEWRFNEEGFSRRLADLDPHEFYQAVVRWTLLRYCRSPVLKEAQRDFYNLLRSEEAWLLSKLWRREWRVRPTLLVLASLYPGRLRVV
ncbi:MAG: hypothetical protein NTU41_06330 [Chloroflexi bacterium]|nr:hypothetical protein [Chloroflexota bacterium]